jgi:tRNA modification GTPase
VAGVRLLTSPGPAGIAVVRLWGPPTAEFVERHLETTPHWTRGQILRGKLLDETRAPIDDILISVHAVPPDWDIRLHLHGNPWLVRRCTELATACGLVLDPDDSPPIWPSANRIESEASALLPQMLTLRGARWLLDQARALPNALRAISDSDLKDAVRTRCRGIAQRIRIVEWFARPLKVALAGPPNAGKSSLANALARQAASIVSSTPGTTRDWVEIPAELEGYPVVWIDTAGLRQTDDLLESASVARTAAATADADTVIVVLDITDPTAADTFGRSHSALEPACVVLNKCDLDDDTDPVTSHLPPGWCRVTVRTSAIIPSGLERLAAVLLRGTGRADADLVLPSAFTARQAGLLENAAAATSHNSFQENILQIIA